MSKLIIYHHNDVDGRCAAAIMSRSAGNKFSEIIFHEVDYKDHIDTNIEKGSVVAVLDFSFKPSIMEVIRTKAEVIWCDHHVTAKEYGYNDLVGIRDFTPYGKCGAECTWKYCYGNLETPYALELIGDYDSWRMKHTPVVLNFQEGIKTEDTTPQSPIWNELLSDHSEALVTQISRIGETVIKYRDNYCQRMSNSYGYETSIDGHTAFAMNIYGFGSNAFSSEIREKYDIVVVFIHDGSQFIVSLYSKKIDVSKMAQKYGGGGHRDAAGFTCFVLPFVKSDRR